MTKLIRTIAAVLNARSSTRSFGTRAASAPGPRRS